MFRTSLTKANGFSKANGLFSRAFSTTPRALGTKVFLQTSIDGEVQPPIRFELYDDVVPKTVENFKVLASGEKDVSYKGSTIHRIIPQFMIQGGDFETGKGYGGYSPIWGKHFPDENFTKKHDRPGLLSMANAGPNTNGSQFFITTIPTPWLDGYHVVFGEVIDGYDVVKKIESYGSEHGEPTARIVIEDSGVEEEKK
ncbi:CPR3 [Candida oxycetoniae]|uniref:Peptidyl-prolyl cis-trans isomerase n=1 Tax=Candida oxycetoniae TaxID=497107 RepID=A0AAI9T0T0_9ASCO|nr:CPR3 [Candida oxycetoniae]KAI3406756.1 CPR3 [Candida oxycetoniae]